MILLGSLGASCDRGAGSAPSRTTFARDPRAARLGAIQQGFARGAVSPADVELLEALSEQYPEEQAVATLLEQVLVRRGDWNALVRLRSRTPPEERSASESCDLGKLLIKAQRFDEAASILDRLVAQHPDEIEYRWLHGFADYSRGSYAGAIATFERFESPLLAAGRTQCLLLRGLSRFQLDQMDQAIADLTAFVEREPDDISGCNGLARALVAVGREAEARPLLARVDELHARRNAAEKQQVYLAGRTRDLDRALARRDLGEGEQIIREILPHAEGAFREQLLEILDGMQPASR